MFSVFLIRKIITRSFNHKLPCLLSTLLSKQYIFVWYRLFAVYLLGILLNIDATMFSGQPQFTLKTERNKKFDDSCLVGTYNVESGGISDCLEHCLENCRCQSFQICRNTKCQLCSSHKEENSSLLHENDDCVYIMYDLKEELIGVRFQVNCLLAHWRTCIKVMIILKRWNILLVLNINYSSCTLI